MKWINSIIHSWGALAPCNMFIYIIVSRVNSCIFVSKWCSQNGHILNINIFMYLIVLIFLPIISFLNYFKLGNKLFTKKKKEYYKHPKEWNFVFIYIEVLWTRPVRTPWTDETKLLSKVLPVKECSGSWSWGPALELENCFRRLSEGFS